MSQTMFSQDSASTRTSGVRQADVYGTMIIVDEIMSDRPIFTQSNLPVEEALQTAEQHGVHYLIVADAEGDLLGVACVCDLTRAESGTRVGLVTHQPAVFVNRGQPVGRVAEIMQQCGVGCLPVADSQGVICGIVTRHDLREIGAWNGPSARPRCTRCGTSHSIHCVQPGQLAFCDDCLRPDVPMSAEQEVFSVREQDTL